MHGIWLVGGDWQSAYTLEQFKGRFPSCCDDSVCIHCVVVVPCTDLAFVCRLRSGPGSCRVRLIHFLARWHKGNVNEGLVSLGWFACAFVVFINCCSGFLCSRLVVVLLCCQYQPSVSSGQGSHSPGSQGINLVTESQGILLVVR